MESFIGSDVEDPISAIVANTNAELIVNNYRVEDISAIAPKHWLRYLTLENLSIRDLSAIAGMQLHSLWLENLTVFALPEIPSLKMLTLHDLPWTFNISAMRLMPDLQELNISSLRLKDVDTLAAISTQLTRLNISHTENRYCFMIHENLEYLSASGVSQIPPLPKLRRLYVHNDSSILSRIHEYPELNSVDSLMITQETAGLFYNLLRINTSIEYITVVIFPINHGYKKYYKNIVDKILKCLRHNTTLKELSIMDSYTSYKGKKKVQKLFQHNTTLQKLTLETNFEYDHPACNFVVVD